MHQCSGKPRSLPNLISIGATYETGSFPGLLFNGSFDRDSAQPAVVMESRCRFHLPKCFSTVSEKRHEPAALAALLFGTLASRCSMPVLRINQGLALIYDLRFPSRIAFLNPSIPSTSRKTLGSTENKTRELPARIASIASKPRSNPVPAIVREIRMTPALWTKVKDSPFFRKALMIEGELVHSAKIGSYPRADWRFLSGSDSVMRCSFCTASCWPLSRNKRLYRAYLCA